MPTCDDAARDPETYCPAMPWCEACNGGCMPGGGGAFRPAPLAYDRPMWVGDHGQFASWVNRDIIAAFVVKINKDGTVDVQITMPNGSHFIEPSVRVTPSEGEYDDYLRHREVAQRYRREALKSACAEFSKLTGQMPLHSVYHDGYYYPADHDFRNTAFVVEQLPGEKVNIDAYFRRFYGVMHLRVPAISDLHLPHWLQSRDIWLPIREKHFAEAQKKIDQFIGKGYSQ